MPNSKKTIGKLLIEPTKIYVDPILDLYNKNILKTCAHITGGGVTENLPRVITNDLYAHINLSYWKLPPLFKWIMSMGVPEKEMLKTFILCIINKHVRLCLIVPIFLEISKNWRRKWFNQIFLAKLFI